MKTPPLLKLLVVLGTLFYSTHAFKIEILPSPPARNPVTAVWTASSPRDEMRSQVKASRS